MNHYWNKEEDNQFRMQLLKDIPYFHQLYAKYHDPKWLELAKTVGAHTADLKMREYKQEIIGTKQAV
mgnify:CR=1 FL=1